MSAVRTGVRAYMDATPLYSCTIPESNFKIKTGDWKSFSMKWQILIASQKC